MKRIAIINQRYGNDVGGGSEYYTALIARHLSQQYEVEVLTTCAKDYQTWANEFEAGVQTDGAVKVRRFPVRHKRRLLWFRVLNLLIQRWGLHLGFLERLWVLAQGPVCPALVKYIEKERDHYDTFFFVTYLYYPTVRGIWPVLEKSVLIPTAHDEYCIYMKPYRELFMAAKRVIFLSDEEKAFVNGLYEKKDREAHVFSIGVEVPQVMEEKDTPPNTFRGFIERHGIHGRYVIYAGRVEVSKNCDLLFEYFLRYKKECVDDLQLVVVGHVMMDIPKNEAIHVCGFVSPEDKDEAIAGAEALLMPSMYESLSIATLEAMAMGVPPLVNGNCEVLKAHVEKSGAGACFRDYEEFQQALSRLATEPQHREQQREKAIAYIRQNYQWSTVMKGFEDIIEMR